MPSRFSLRNVNCNWQHRLLHIPPAWQGLRSCSVVDVTFLHNLRPQTAVETRSPVCRTPLEHKSKHNSINTRKVVQVNRLFFCERKNRYVILSKNDVSLIIPNDFGLVWFEN